METKNKRPEDWQSSIGTTKNLIAWEKEHKKHGKILPADCPNRWYSKVTGKVFPDLRSRAGSRMIFEPTIQRICDYCYGRAYITLKEYRSSSQKDRLREKLLRLY